MRSCAATQLPSTASYDVRVEKKACAEMNSKNWRGKSRCVHELGWAMRRSETWPTAETRRKSRCVGQKQIRKYSKALSASVALRGTHPPR